MIIGKLRSLKRHILRKTEGEQILLQSYAEFFGRPFDQRNMRTFSQKLFGRMIDIHRHGNPTFTELADKYLVRDYVREKIGSHHLVDLVWSGKDPRDIPFERLPDKCVAKTNHGSGGNIIITPASNRSEIVAKLRAWLKQSYYWYAREYHYHAIEPRVIVERFLDDGRNDGPLDYRFFTFRGKTAVIQVDNHKHDINPFYDSAWNKLDLRYRKDVRDCNIERPENLSEMIDVAARLGEDFDFVRVDLYNVRGRIYFGELTFTPVSGRFAFRPSEWDSRLGELWKD